MKLFLMAWLLACSLVAGDFDWMGGFDGRYANNPTLLQKDLSGRFNLGDTIVSNVVKSVTRPAEAYMVLKMAEMTGKSSDLILKEYRQSNTSNGWGALAQRMGIKPGSAEFRALKAGDDIDKNKVKKTSSPSKKENGKPEKGEKGKPEKGKKDK